MFSVQNNLIPAPIPVNGKSDLKGPGWQTGPRHVICHNRYQDWQYAPDLVLKFRDYPRIVLNCDQLNTDYRARVQLSSYNQALRVFEAEYESKTAAEGKQVGSKH